MSSVLKLYNVGDKLEDSKEPGIIEIIKVTEHGYDVTIDGIPWEYGINKHYVSKNCKLLT